VSMDDLALFDLDNTLLDREKAFRIWSGRFVESHGLDRDAVEVIRQLDGDGLAPREQFLADLRRAFDISTGVDVLLENYYDEYPSFFSVEPETLAAIRTLRGNGVKVGVVTNGPPTQWAKIEAAGLAGEVDAVCISAVVGAWKPDVAIFEAAARACRVPLAGWMVGDSADADMVGGRRAGLKTIWMARGRAWQPGDCSPDFTVATIPEAVDIIVRSG
jgi:putative hydrolase of the HAD superfamily